MAEKKVVNAIYTGATGRKSLYDLQIPNNWNGKLILFSHGYMGYKDWGCWSLVSDYFVENSYGFLKYNVSHNGGTTERPIDFSDVEAFSRNTYSKELTDFECVISTVRAAIDGITEIYLIGHSRGGGIVALQAHQPYVNKWASWAGISSIEDRFPQNDALETWRNETYRYVKNGRTHQELPHHFEQYIDFQDHKDRLDIEAHCKRNKKPCLILHGSQDTSVLPSEASKLANWTNTEVFLVPDAQHTFNTSQPWIKTTMPDALLVACDKTLLFFES